MFEDLQGVWDAYRELATCRPIGMVTGPVPWTAVHEYATRYGMTVDEEEEFLAYVRAIEAAEAPKPD